MNRFQSLIFETAFLMFAILMAPSAFSQQLSLRYIGANGKITDLEHAVKVEKMIPKSQDRFFIQTLVLNDSKWEKATTAKYKLINDSTYRINENSPEFKGVIVRTFVKLPDQRFRFRDEIKNSRVREGTAKSIAPLLLQGEVTEYYKNGNKKSVSVFENNQLVSNKNWNENGEKYIDNIFYSVDVYPTFIPGAQVINKRLITAFKGAGIDITSISGSLVIGFVVNENGKTEGVKVLKGLGQSVNTVAYDTFVNLKGDWTPAKLNNQAVKYFQVFPINFINKSQSLEFVELRGSTLHWAAF
jgi:hypothetical protein